MPRKEVEPLTRRHIHLFTSDLAFLEGLCGRESSGVNYLIRDIVREECDRIREELQLRKGDATSI